TAPAGGRGHHWIRGTAVVVLMVLGFVLVPVAGVAVWTRNTLLNTDRYVETVAPLAQSQAVIDDVAQAVTTAIFNQFDVEAALQKNLPPELSFAAGPIANQVESTTNDLVVKALGSDQFDALWRAVNRQASASVVAFVTGSSSDTAIQVKNGQLVLDIQPILADVKQRLTAEGFDLASKLPSTDATVDLPVANVQYLVDARQLVKLLNTLAWLLPLLALLCFAGAVALSRNRRRALITTALLVSGAALLVGLALAVGRAAYIDATTSEAVSADTAAVVYDTVVRFLKNGLRVFFLLGLVVAFGAAVTGESAWAVATRRTTGRLVTQGGEKSGLDTGRVGAFFARHRTGYRVVTVGVFGVWLFLLNPPTPSALLWLVIGALAVLVVLEFLASTAPRAPEAAEAEPVDVDA
ncbi:MAG: hypothetical protein OEW53_09800, partial [Actinomycetota bacterium]|nr:hypothetical protein [Actinomycetota bacterium]